MGKKQKNEGAGNYFVGKKKLGSKKEKKEKKINIFNLKGTSFSSQSNKSYYFD
jgi:hypothetical protein